MVPYGSHRFALKLALLGTVGWGKKGNKLRQCRSLVKLSIFRWPGGCFVSWYHWKDGVGNDRKSVFDVVWGGEDPNMFGTDEFVEWTWDVAGR